MVAETMVWFSKLEDFGIWEISGGSKNGKFRKNFFPQIVCKVDGWV